MRYAVSIPADGAGDFDTTLTVEASDWMSALRAALRAATPAGPDLLCDIQLDGTVRIVDPSSRRIFHLRPLGVAQSAPAAVRDTLHDAPREALTASEARIVERRRVPSGTFARVEPTIFAPLVDEDIVGTVLEELGWVYDADTPRKLQDVTERVLDLALRLIPSESGAVLFAGLQGKDLFFAAARGPKAAEVMSFRVPLERGIAGLCVREGVSLAVPRARQDERLYREIGESIGWLPETVACAPLKCEGRVFGALELLNKRGGHPYSAVDVARLTHIAGQLAHWIQLQM